MADFDPDAFLANTKSSTTVDSAAKDSGFDPDAFLKNTASSPSQQTQQTQPEFNPDTFASGQTQQTQQAQPGLEPEGPVAPQFVVPGPTGFNAQAVKSTLSPFAQVPGKVLESYGTGAAGAGKAIADTLLATHGAPPVFGGINAIKGLGEAYGAAKESLNTAQGLASKIAETPGVKASFNKLIDALPKAEALRMSDLINKRGAQGLKEFIDSSGDAIKAMPEVKELADIVPSRMAQVGKVVAPVLRGAGKVLGPAGLAMNAYDAAQYAEAAELGKRLAQGQGGTAQHQFKQMNPGYSQQFNQQITPDQAHLILNSNNERDIAAFGGREALTNIAQTPARQVLAQPPTSQNFMQRMQALGYLYHSATQGK